jgi:hypothetical protein
MTYCSKFLKLESRKLIFENLIEIFESPIESFVIRFEIFLSLEVLKTFGTVEQVFSSKRKLPYRLRLLNRFYF